MKRDLDVLQAQMGMAAGIHRDLDDAETRLSDNHSKVQTLTEKIDRQREVMQQHEDTISDMQVRD